MVDEITASYAVASDRSASRGRDCGRGHGRVLGSSVTDFIDRWSLLACAGPEEWLMTPFLHPDQPYLDAVGITAQAWRAWFGVDTMMLV